MRDALPKEKRCSSYRCFVYILTFCFSSMTKGVLYCGTDDKSQHLPVVDGSLPSGSLLYDNRTFTVVSSHCLCLREVWNDVTVT